MIPEKNNRLLLVFLIFPMIGAAGMIFVIMGGSPNDSDAEPDTGLGDVAAFPTPQDIITTPVPTVTVRPIMDAPPPEITITTQSGDDYQLADLDGEIIIVNFWATWCPPCVREMPALEAFAEAHPDVRVLAVTDPDDGQNLELIETFLAENNIDDIEVAFDNDGLLRLNFNAFNLPTTFVIDQNNIVRFRQIGEVTEEDLEFYYGELS